VSRWLAGLVLVLALSIVAAPAAGAAKRRDRDHDRLPDKWEKRYHLSTQKRSGKGDPDHDRLTNRREYKARTNPRRKDTDRDGLTDRAELLRYKTNPRRADTDRDGYKDGAEVRAGTDPRSAASHPGSAQAQVPIAPFTPPPGPPAGCASPVPNVADGADREGGCFPGPSNTGVPAGTALTAYTGSCTISAANTVIDSKTVNCSPLEVGSGASGLVIKNSQVNGGVIQESGSASFTIQDSTIDNAVDYPACTAPSSCAAGSYACGDPDNATTQCGVGYRNFTILRTEILNTNRAAYCQSSCLIEDSYFHGTNLWPDHTNQAHASSIRVEQNTTLVHNSLACDYRGPFTNDEIGCSADISGYPDFAPINHNTITDNLFGSNNEGAGFCVYGGGTANKPYSGDPTNATYVVFQDNVFQRGANGKCGSFGPVTDFESGRTGNVWSGNVSDNGKTVPAAD
jgi:hypothetical protein